MSLRRTLVTLTTLLACAVPVAACGASASESAGPPRGAALTADFSGRGPGALAAAESCSTLPTSTPADPIGNS